MKPLIHLDFKNSFFIAILLVFIVGSFGKIKAQSNDFDEPLYVLDYHIKLTMPNVDSLVVEYHRPKGRLKNVHDSIISGDLVLNQNTLETRRTAYYRNDTIFRIVQYEEDFKGEYRDTWDMELEFENGIVKTSLTTFYSGEPSCCLNERYIAEHRWLKGIGIRLFQDEQGKRINVKKLDEIVERNDLMSYISIVDSIESTNVSKWLFSKIVKDDDDSEIGIIHYFKESNGETTKWAFLELKKQVVDKYVFDNKNELIERSYTSTKRKNDLNEYDSQASRKYILHYNDQGDWTSMIWNYSGIVTRKLYYSKL